MADWLLNDFFVSCSKQTLVGPLWMKRPQVFSLCLKTVHVWIHACLVLVRCCFFAHRVSADTVWCSAVGTPHLRAFPCFKYSSMFLLHCFFYVMRMFFFAKLRGQQSFLKKEPYFFIFQHRGCLKNHVTLTPFHFSCDVTVTYAKM